MRAIAATAVLAVTLAGSHTGAAAERMVADLSSRIISITSSFAGAELLLFGAIEEPGDVVVSVRGAEQEVIVRRKSRLAAIWVNRDSVRFARVPSYFVVASSAPLADILPEADRRELRLGTDYLDFEPLTKVVPGELAMYREALVRNKAREGLYQESEGTVQFLDTILFRTMVAFPSNAPPGDYSVDVYLVRDQRIVSAKSIPLFISKSGIERAVFDFANEMPIRYGLVAVTMALIAGWLASLVARRP